MEGRGGEGRGKVEGNGSEERRCRAIDNVLRLNRNHYYHCFFAPRIFPNGLL